MNDGSFFYQVRRTGRRARCPLLALLVALTSPGVGFTSRADTPVPPFVFTKHFDMGGSHYAYTEALSDDYRERHFSGGSALCLRRTTTSGSVIDTLLSSPQGVIRDPDVSWDADRILFSWKKSDRGDDYHLYEMKLPSREIRQLTFGKGFADYEGAYLPNDDIVFNSSRCVQRVDYWLTPVSNLFLCNKDGEFMRRIAYDQVHTNYPTVLSDGRVMFTRWEYNDRGQIHPQPLFVMNPDGTMQTELYGNNSWFPVSLLHARDIPGTGKVVAVLSGHHCRQNGKPAIINPRVARNCELGSSVRTCGIEYLEDVTGTKYENAFVEGREGRWGREGNQYQYPYPLSEEEFLIGGRLGTDEHFKIYYFKKGQPPRVLVSDPDISCNQPVPLVARPRPPRIASKVDYRETTGTFSIQNIYVGGGLRGVDPGTIKKLRVIALEYRAETMEGSHKVSGPAGFAPVHLPVALENGSWDVKRVLGDATVYDDGSTYFEVPARTPVYFQALDERGYAVQSMRSWSTLQPGEHFGCVGCHENKLEAPPPMSGTSMAMAGGVEKLSPFYGPARGFSFIEEIQPILDKHCISCHDSSHKKLDLTDRLFTAYNRRWTVSYRNLFKYISVIGVQSVPTMLPPYAAGAHNSLLIRHLETGHTAIPFPGDSLSLSGEEIHKVACWIDLLAPFAGDYTENLTEEALEVYNRGLEKRARWEREEAENISNYVAWKGTRAGREDRGIRAVEGPVIERTRFDADGRLWVDFADNAPAVSAVSLFDIAGRRRLTVHVGESNPGSADSGRNMPLGEGIYVLRTVGGATAFRCFVTTRRNER